MASQQKTIAKGSFDLSQKVGDEITGYRTPHDPTQKRQTEGTTQLTTTKSSLACSLENKIILFIIVDLLL
jgi:hypothetical protein